MDPIHPVSPSAGFPQGSSIKQQLQDALGQLNTIKDQISSGADLDTVCKELETVCNNLHQLLPQLPSDIYMDVWNAGFKGDIVGLEVVARELDKAAVDLDQVIQNITDAISKS